MINYHNVPVVNARLIRTSNLFREQLIIVENAWNAVPGNTRIDLSGLWSEYIADRLLFVEGVARTFLGRWISAMAAVWAGRRLTDPVMFAIVQAALAQFRVELANLHIGTVGLL